MSQGKNHAQRSSALRIVGIYLFFGAAWILVSDTILGWFVRDHEMMTTLEIFKGWAFILLTSVLLYRLIDREISRRRQIMETMRKSGQVSATLNRISKAFLTANDDEEMYDEVLRIVLEDMESKYGVFGYIDEHGDLVCPSMTRHIWSRCQMSNKTIVFPENTWGDSIWGHSLRTARAQYRNSAFKVAEGHVPIDRCLTAPIVFKERSLGLLTVANKSSDYTDDDLNMLQLITEHLAPILSARLLQQRSEGALRESESRLNESQRIARLGHYVFDAVSGFWSSSQVLDEIFGIDQDFSRDVAGWLLIVHPEQREEMRSYLTQHVLNEGKVFDREYRIQRISDNAVRWVHGLGRLELAPDGQVLKMFGTIQDITERKRTEDDRRRLEQQMLHAQKLESLGILAGGIAHDFNNILMSVIGNAELALMRLNPESPVVENLHHIEQAANRAADLARQMLAYSGKGKFTVEMIDLNRLIDEMTHMLQVSISKKAMIRFDLAKALPAMEADATQVRQVIMNLVINASEAIGERNGVISISTGCKECDRGYLKGVWLDDQLPEGLYVYLEVADTGCGMDRETLNLIFDPFFTTKFTGRGLGMAAVLGIVRSHKGAVKVHSEVNRGTTFKILFPASSEPAELPRRGGDDAAWHESGAILLVDDEETVRAVCTEMLKELGFTAITASDGLEALQRYQEHPGIRIVILDLTMPHMDGEQAFRELRRLDPTVRVILSSGYNESEVMQKFAGKEFSGFLQKPYDIHALKEVLKKAMA